MSTLIKLNGSLGNSQPMPVLFLGHGSPMNAIEENEFVKGFRVISKEIPKPNAIICISAHWETNGTKVTAMEKPSTIHDFGGFPKELYQVQYPAKGSPMLAVDINEQVKHSDIELDTKWGLDHGSWSVVKHLYPHADVPVIQISLDYYKTPQQHYELALELASYRSKGVLIIGSGNIVHNLRMIAWDKMSLPEYGYDWAIEANKKMKELMETGNQKLLMNYRSFGTAFNNSIPTPEHFIPLLYSLALKKENEQVNFFNDKVIGGSISMTSIIIK